MKRLLVALLLACASGAAHADGGHLQMRQDVGPFIVSLFTQPESLGVGQADLSAMIEERANGKVLLDADVAITLVPENAQGEPIVVHLSRARATNRLLQDAIVQLPHAGKWRATIQVNEAERKVSVATDLMVGDHSARRGTVWTFALLPLCVIALFSWVQAAKRQPHRRRLLSEI